MTGSISTSLLVRSKHCLSLTDTMAILAIHDVQINDDSCTVEALVEDTFCIRKETRLDPAEYAPGVCQASFPVPDDCPIPKDESQFIDMLDELDLDWELVQPDDDY